MEDYLYQKDLYVSLLGTDAGKGKLTEDEYKILDRKALGAIRAYLSERVFFNIANEITTVGVMEALEKMYEKPLGANKVFIIKKLFNSKKERGMSATEYVNQFNSILTQLATVKITFDDVNALLILSGLPDGWNSLVVIMGNSHGNENLTFNNMVMSILGEESWQKIVDEDDGHGAALHIEEYGRGNEKKEGSDQSPRTTETTPEGPSRESATTVRR